MSEYLLRKVKGHYSIAKFDSSDSPVDVYTFYPRGCSCPAGRRGCKHQKILKEWQKLKEQPGFVFNDEAVVIGVLAVT